MTGATSDEGRACPMPVLFSTEGIRDRDRRSAYRDWMGDFGTFERLHPGDGPAFAVLQTGLPVDGLFLMRERCSPMRASVLRTRQHASRVDHWLFALQLRGRTSTRTGDATALKTPGSLSVRCLARPGTVDLAQSRSDTLYLLVPRAVLPSASAALERMDGQTLDGPMARMLADHIAAVARVAAALPAGQLQALGRATTALIEACFGSSSDAVRQEAPLSDGARRRKIVEFVSANLSEPRLSPSFLCNRLGVSRSCLYRLFERDGGVMEFVIEERLRRAHAVLTDPAEYRRIHEIAAEHGFSSPEHFSRAFRRRFGCTPREARAGVQPAPSVDEGPAAGDFAALLGAKLRRARSSPVGGSASASSSEGGE